MSSTSIEQFIHSLWYFSNVASHVLSAGIRIKAVLILQLFLQQKGCLHINIVAPIGITVLTTGFQLYLIAGRLISEDPRLYADCLADTLDHISSEYLTPIYLYSFF